MNRLHSARRMELDALQSRIALGVTAHLSERAQTLPHELSERLRVAREHALQRARRVRQADTVPAAATQWSPQGNAAVAQGSSWWLRLASAAPLLMLVLGLVFIQHLHRQAEIRAAADVDAALLADDLPPEAYRDPGFVVFLKQPEP
jgi:hypothetical protein